MLEHLIAHEDPDALNTLQNLDQAVQRLIDSRMRFLILDPTTGDGLVPAEVGWDVVPPAWRFRYRHGNHIIGITTTAAKQLPPVPEAVWEAYEGGRIVMDIRRAEAFPLNSRRVRQGRLEYAIFKGERGSPIVLRQCSFEQCHFIGCIFESVDFIDCDFLGSVFDGCRFVSCAASDTHFADTVWGNPKQPDRANTIDQCRQTGRVTYDGASGVGPALFMPDWAATQAQQATDEYLTAKRTEPPLWNHTQLRFAIAETNKHPNS